MNRPEKCPGCESLNLVTVQDGVPPPHFAKLICGDCGRHLMWLPGPVAQFRIPFGKHKGRTLAEINGTDRGYLEWIGGNADFNPKIQVKVREFLAENIAPALAAPSRPAEWDWQHPKHPLHKRQREGDGR